MWKIFAGLCIRRPAVVSPSLSPLQLRVQDYYSDLEVKQSHLSAHEVLHRNDLERMAQVALEQQHDGKKPRSSQQAAFAGSLASLLTAKDMELSWEMSEKLFWDEINEFGVTRRSEGNETKMTDKTPPTNTAWRHLDRSLILLTRQRLGTTFDWGLPVTEVTGDATLRSAVEELAQSLLPPESHWKIVGNAPVAVHKYAYRTPNGEKQRVQMYFLNAFVDKLWRGENVLAENNDNSGDRVNFAWITLEEMENLLENKKFLRRLHTFIVDY